MDDLISDQQQTLENTLLSLKEAVEWQLKLILAAIKRIATEDYGFPLALPVAKISGFYACKPRLTLRIACHAKRSASSPSIDPSHCEGAVRAIARVRPRHFPFQPQLLQFGHD